MRGLPLFDRHWQKYLSALWQEKTALFTALISALGKSFAAIGFALVLRSLLQKLTEHHGPPASTILAALALALLAAAFGLGNRYSVIWLVQGVVHSIRRDLIAKVMTLGPTTVATLGRAHLLDVAVQDSERMDRMTNTIVGGILPSVMLAVGYSLALLWVAPAFGAMSIAIGAVFWLCNQVLYRRIASYAHRYAAAFAGFSRSLLLTIERLGLIRARGLARIEMEERDADLRSLRKVAIATDQAIGTISEAVSLLGDAATVVLIVAASLVSTSGLMLVDIMIAYLLLLMIRTQVMGVSATTPDLEIGIAAFSRIQKLLEAADERPYSGSRKIAFKGNIELKNVCFGFGDEPLLSGLNLILRQGSTVVITGANGSGKTTLLNLVLGIYRPREGSVTADGLPYEELDIPSLLGSVGYVPQEPMLFADTIARNISYGQPSATLQQIEHVARLAGAHDFIRELSEGYFTQVGDLGAFLSGGQKQRIALARALLGHNSLLILDEPTNHLDQHAVSGLLGTLMENEDTPAVLIITHDSAVMEAADRVLELRDGLLLQPQKICSFEPGLERSSHFLHS